MIVVASLVLAGILTLRIWGIVEDEPTQGEETELQEQFKGGSSRVQLNTTFLGTDTHIELPADAEVRGATLSVSGSLPPQRRSYQAGRTPIDIAVGDIDGDLYTDALVANNGDGTIMIMEHNGKSLSRGSVYDAGEGPIAVVMENLDDHPLPDAAVLSEDSRELRIFLNNERGGLRSSGEPFNFTEMPADMVCFDHDSDGDMDIAVITTNNDNLTIFTNDGTGSFQRSYNQTVQGNPTRIAAADMNNDGSDDLVISNRRDVISWSGEPHQYFDKEKERPSNWLSTVSVWLRDDDGPGYHRDVDDLRSQKGVSSIDLGDLNNDGFRDIVTSNLGYHNVSIMFSDGEGGYHRGPEEELDQVTLGSMDPTQVILHDLEEDGDLDILALSRSSDSVLIYRNRGDGTFGEPEQYYVGLNPTSMELMDFDSDGDQDIVTSDWKGWIEKHGGNGTVSVLINLREGIFGTYRQYGTGNSPRGVFTRDVDGDGDVDIASANYFGSTISILNNDGLGRFSLPREYPIGLEPYAVVLEDFNGDGHIDAASADEANFRIILLRSDEEGGFTTERYLYDIGAYPFSLRTGDIDSDGDMDLYTSNYFQGSTTLMFNDGSGNFSTMFSDYKTIPLGDDLPYDSLMEDVDGDGLMDLITVDRGDSLDPTDTVSVMINNGTFDFEERTKFEVGKEPTSAVIHDLDKDGYPDIVTSNTGDDTISVLINDGTGSFFKLGDYPAGNRPQYVNLLDMDQDGWMDIIATNTDTNNMIFLMNEEGKDFRLVQDLNIGSYPYAIDTADFNSDGREDITISVVNTNNVLVLGCYWYPSDISIDLGADGTIDWVHNGIMKEDDVVEFDMTDALVSYLEENDAKGSVKVPVRVIAGQEGVVELSDLIVVYS